MRIADLSRPVVAVLAEFVCNCPARIPSLNSVAAMGHWGSWSWLEWIVTGTATAVTFAGNFVGLVKLLQVTVPVAACLARLLGEDTIKREEANTSSPSGPC